MDKILASQLLQLDSRLTIPQLVVMFFMAKLVRPQSIFGSSKSSTCLDVETLCQVTSRGWLPVEVGDWGWWGWCWMWRRRIVMKHRAMYIIEDSIHIMNMTWLINMKVYIYIYFYTIYVYVRIYLYKRSIYTLYNVYLFPEMVLCFFEASWWCLWCCCWWGWWWCSTSLHFNPLKDWQVPWVENIDRNMVSKVIAVIAGLSCLDQNSNCLCHSSITSITSSEGNGRPHRAIATSWNHL